MPRRSKKAKDAKFKGMEFQFRQFLLEILGGNQHNHIISWTEKMNKFHILKIEELARLWGLHINDDKMKTAKLKLLLSSLCHKDIIQEEVPEDKFVYRFLPVTQTRKRKTASSCINFLLNLLKGNRYSHVMKWTENQDEFCILNIEELVKLWGMRVKNRRMNYSKVARILKILHSRNVIQEISVPKLTYSFLEITNSQGNVPLNAGSGVQDSQQHAVADNSSNFESQQCSLTPVQQALEKSPNGFRESTSCQKQRKPPMQDACTNVVPHEQIHGDKPRMRNKQSLNNNGSVRPSDADACQIHCEQSINDVMDLSIKSGTKHLNSDVSKRRPSIKNPAPSFEIGNPITAPIPRPSKRVKNHVPSMRSRWTYTQTALSSAAILNTNKCRPDYQSNFIRNFMHSLYVEEHECRVISDSMCSLDVEDVEFPIFNSSSVH